MHERAATEELLAACASVYRELLDLARRKQEALISGRTADLEPIIGTEEALLGELAHLERRWLEAGGLGRAVGTADELDRLRRTVTELRRISEQNVMLLQQALRYVEFSVRVLSPAQDATIYGAQGAAVAGATRVIDRRA
ncbi:MAG TPA: flagellar protein FlgN [Bacillota bacterium]